MGASHLCLVYNPLVGELDVVESRTDGQDTSEELLGVVSAPRG